MRRIGFAIISVAFALISMHAAEGIGSAFATGIGTLSPYAPFPQSALTNIGASFSRPTNAQVFNARVSALHAYAVAMVRMDTRPGNAKVTERLGVFSDTMMKPPIIRIVCYAVIFDGVSVPSLGPTSGPPNHELVVIINAKSGRIVESFSHR
jgi:hypothetical protein